MGVGFCYPLPRSPSAFALTAFPEIDRAEGTVVGGGTREKGTDFNRKREEVSDSSPDQRISAARQAPPPRQSLSHDLAASASAKNRHESSRS